MVVPSSENEIAAMCMIGLLKYIEPLRGESASDIVEQSPPIEGDVVAAIRYTPDQEYGNFVALFLREKYANRWLPSCPACGVQPVVSAKCEACFTELKSVGCPECHEEGCYIALEYATCGTVQIECLDATARRWRRLTAPLFDPYQPELHYMRGPGPKWREKHARGRWIRKLGAA
jgi:hypothetical protein